MTTPRNGHPLDEFAQRVSRRRLLQVGALGLTGLSLPRLLAAGDGGAGSPIQPRADACILIFLNGGPSHLDMWDMKPAAPHGIRGEFQPIDTSLPGVQLCEHLPRLATQMHRCSLVRGMHHSVNNAHAAAVYTAMTGHDRGDAQVIIGAGPEDYPTPGAVLSTARPAPVDVVSQVALPYKTKEGAGGPPQPGFFGGLLGRAHDPLFVLKDPNAEDFSVPELSLRGGVSPERLTRRRELLGSVNARLADAAGVRRIDDIDGFKAQALDLLTSQRAQQAFRIADEPATRREAYGRNIYGQSVLLARRLIEAGTRMVTVSWAPDANATWDTHGGNFKKLKGSLLPQFDAACTSLIEDLAERGMLERTLVAVLGDFGRTPKINKSDGGRDHWNWCYTIMLAGGGIRAGHVDGASDSIGAFPARQPRSPGDVIATMYHLLGVRHDGIIYDQLRRPHRLVPTGEVISGLLA